MSIATTEAGTVADLRQTDLENHVRIVRTSRAPICALGGIVTTAALKRELFAQCEQAGGQAAWAREKKVPPSLVAQTLAGTRSFSPCVANAMGFVTGTAFVRTR